MSWHKTENEGKTMWERSDGMRVSSHEQIDAIEKYESSQYKNRLDNFHWIDDDPPEEPVEPLTIWHKGFLIGCVLVLIMAFVFNK